ncbi:hydrogenase maturation carbamoyltransferase HypF [Sulfuritortus calidifontis]|uniref:Carbamoyltransferase HypF n=1 Tax=Sulfuritortus calidifontis TaxID=1914471 RepID=A0A4R3JXB2_9PROT|nr:carbamoyltransferase HypF [Sulfuritortus calidifontis]TCS73073.1 hydrogenase maturation carbamoyltransferase HypF [Sulfuritortus calidifontis]
MQTDTGSARARRLTLAGRVQGVGFRPFVYRLAKQLAIKGWVRNVTGQVVVHAEADAAALAAFTAALIDEAPAAARPKLLANDAVAAEGQADFQILDSEAGTPDIHLPPDLFACPDCLRELVDPSDRRHRYPFINCTQCGPRYTLIERLPYDRPNTAMRGFPLCPACRGEYQDPMNRRFHAEPVACPVCGPHLSYVQPNPSPSGRGVGVRATTTGPTGNAASLPLPSLYPRAAGAPPPAGEVTICGDEAALQAAIAALKAGRIVALKGIGGYHLMCDAGNETAVATLRARKKRPAKPFAVLFPPDEEALHRSVTASAAELDFLRSAARPILLLPRRAGSPLADGIAPGLKEIGCLLPYSPLHHLLLAGFGGPLVATSANISGEPVLTDNHEAQARLGQVADGFLHHDRPIVRPADDAVYRPIAGRPRPLRLGRGVAPVELRLPRAVPQPVLALGAHSKNSIALAWGDRAVLSPHIGELGSAKSLDVLALVAADLQDLYQVRAEHLLLDHHPGYGYRPFARGTGLPTSAVWHHEAHASALAWEFPDVANWIVFAWDGVGLGEGDQLHGGEAYVGRPGHWQRAASFRPFRLPGGDQAAREPWRAAAALLWETEQPAPFAPALLKAAWDRGLNSPASTAVGRLFDAAAALTGLCTKASFEAEAPMRLEAAAAASLPPLYALQGAQVGEGRSLPIYGEGRGGEFVELSLTRDAHGLWRSDWSPLLPYLTDTSRPVSARAAGFHLSLAHALLDQAERLRAEHGIGDVGLTGGVFQNRLLTEQVVALLTTAGFRVHLPEQVPVNDAGIALGQIMEWLYG